MKNQIYKPQNYTKELQAIVKELLKSGKQTEKTLRKILSKYPKDGDKIFPKDQLIQGFYYLQSKEMISPEIELPKILKMKPTRTISGVVTVTVLTKPFPCPGKCIFCPNDVRMPKSYIASEPGAQRAIHNRFNPCLQVYNRLKALHAIGHTTEKIEVLVLGGTWSYYPERYQIWFITEIFKALNDFDPRKNSNSTQITKKEISSQKQDDINNSLRDDLGENATYNEIVQSDEYRQKFGKNIDDGSSVDWGELENQQKINESAKARCVGLVLETRPDTLNETQVRKLRKFGATKIQIGVQTLNPKANKANKRMENKQQISRAFALLRQAGFKIHAHMMPNLYKATIESDKKSYYELFHSEDFKPDELKIYPTSVIPYTDLDRLFRQGKYKPYSKTELIDLLENYIKDTPGYCRITRMIRDIPSTEISTGNKATNLRQTVEERLRAKKIKDNNIRAREVRSEELTLDDLDFKLTKYRTKTSDELFLEFVTKEDKIAGFLRLSLPRIEPFIKELKDSAIIREIHVYGPALKLSAKSHGQAQHLGLGSKLIQSAKKLAKSGKFKKLAVISAIGTREYYRKRGFEDGDLYQSIDLV